MPITKKWSLTNKERNYWEEFAPGYEKTRSAEIIEQSLTLLMKKRVFISLTQKGYKSGPTILVGIDNDQLMIDKPIDWPSVGSRMRLSFRDNSKLLNHCFVSLVSATSDTIYAGKPAELYRLQRRSSHRVDTPYGSRVSFSYQGLTSRKFIIKNISAGGMLFCTRRQLRLNGAKLTDITVNIPLAGISSTPNKEDDFRVDLDAGEVVRTCHDKNSDFFCYGLSFLPKPQEEDSLAKYVRFRELELLRTGVQI